MHLWIRSTRRPSRKGSRDGRIRRLHFLARGHVALLARLALYRSLFRLDHRLHRLSPLGTTGRFSSARMNAGPRHEKEWSQKIIVSLIILTFFYLYHPASTRLPRWPIAGARIPVLCWGYRDRIVIPLIFWVLKVNSFAAATSVSRMTTK